jgi:hypothetical protein
MSKKKGKVQAIPDWMKIVSDGAYIGHKEVCEIFCVKNIDAAIKSGRVPPPDWLCRGEFKSNPGKYRKWKMESVRAFVNKKASE